LQTGHIACCKGLFKRVCKLVEAITFEVGRADQVQAALRNFRCAFG